MDGQVLQIALGHGAPYSQDHPAAITMYISSALKVIDPSN
jgi:hypothetical protein